MSGNDLQQPRLQKLNILKEAGVNAYPALFKRTHSNKEAIALLQKTENADPAIAENKQTQTDEVTVAGRLTAKRKMGQIVFADITDEYERLQLFMAKNELDAKSIVILENCDLGDFIGVRGVVSRTKTGEITVKAAELFMLNKSLQPLPEKFHGLTDTETRYRQRYLDLISNMEVRDIFRKRAQIIGAIRQYLNGRGFMEVETPILHPSVGGAAARPFATHYNALDQDYYLRIALELHLKRLIVGGYEKVYEIGRCFRNEGIDTRHNPEFTMMECYQAYADYQDVMNNTEQMIHAAVVAATGGEKVIYHEQEINFALPWRRLDFRQTIMEACGIDYTQYADQASLLQAMQDQGIKADPKRERGKLIDDLLAQFVEPQLIQPTFLVDYPLDMSPLAKTKENDALTVERFELFAGGMELANAFSELNDPQEQRRRFAKQLEAKRAGQEETLLEKEEETIDEDFINALEYGMPPTGGLGIGIDRLSMLISGHASIREVVLFPQLKSKE